MWKLYNKGKSKLEKEFDILRIIKNLRILGIYMRE